MEIGLQGLVQLIKNCEIKGSNCSKYCRTQDNRVLGDIKFIFPILLLHLHLSFIRVFTLRVGFSDSKNNWYLTYFHERVGFTIYDIDNESSQYEIEDWLRALSTHRMHDNRALGDIKFIFPTVFLHLRLSFIRVCTLQVGFSDSKNNRYWLIFMNECGL